MQLEPLNKCGYSTFIYLTFTYVNNLTSGQTVLKLDFNNASNSLHRDIMLMAVNNYLPHLRNFAGLCYAQPSELYFGNEIIMSEEGAQQGDPLGSMLFCLAIQPMVVKLLSEFNVWYIDDGRWQSLGYLA